MEGCDGADGLACIGGYLYSGFNFMIFPTNRKCPKCNPASEKPETIDDEDVSG